MRHHLMVLGFVTICTIILLPAPAQANPYQNAGEVTDADIALKVISDKTAEGDTSTVTFNGAGYTHTLGRVTIEMIP